MTKKADLRTTNIMVADNNFIKAKYDKKMSINAMKLLRLAITQCKKQDNDFFEYEIHIMDMAEMFGITSDNIYREVNKISDELLHTLIYIGDGNPKHKYKKYTLFSECSYDGQGVITFCLNNRMKEFFLQLKRDFTRIPIGVLVTMKSKHSMRIYELICEKLKSTPIYADKSKVVYLPLEELRMITNTEDKLQRISQFKLRVMDTAIKEINNSDAGWYIDYEDVKQGKNIVGFNVTVKGQFANVVLAPERQLQIDDFLMEQEKKRA